MLETYTARYLRTEIGYTGQIVEWPEVVTEGTDVEECREMLRDAIREMVAAYRELRKELPGGRALIEPIPVEV